jgi:DNA mismatch repair ATPase MutL
VDFTEITETSIQEEFNKLIAFKFNNTCFSGSTEPNAFGQKRLDYLISYVPTHEHLVFYEFKTVIKSNENSISERMVFPDLIKLALKKHDHKSCHSYFMLAGKTNVFKEAINNEGLRLPNKFEDKFNKEKIVLTIEQLRQVLNHNDFNSHLNELEDRKIKKISISPSRWKHFEGMSVLFFKMNNNIYKD